MQEQVTFSGPSGQLTGLLCLPSDTPHRAVVLCHPLFEEQKGCQQTLATTARALQQHNCAALLFDLSGCGDSEGAFEASSPAGWIEDVVAATHWLQERSQCQSVALVGVRLTALFVLRAAQQLENVHSIVLWEPAMDGTAYLQTYLRRKLIKRMMTFGKSSGSSGDLLKTLEQEELIDLDGYIITHKMYRDLCGMGIEDTPLPDTTDLFTIQIGPKEVFAQHTLSTLQELLGSPERLHTIALRMQPFWQLSDPIDTSALIDCTVEWMTGSRT